MGNPAFSASYEDFASAGATLIRDIRYVEVFGREEACVISAGDRGRIKEMPLPKDGPFLASVNAIAETGFVGRVVYAPFEFPDGRLRMYVQPVECAEAFLAQIGKTVADVDRFFGFMAFGMIPDRVQAGDEQTLLAELRVGVKESRNIVVETALRIGLERDISIHSLHQDRSTRLTNRPYLRRCVQDCLKVAGACNTNEAVLLCVQREQTKHVYCFSEARAQEGAKQLLRPDGIQCEVVCHVRSGSMNLDLTSLAQEAGSLLGCECTAGEHQMLMIKSNESIDKIPDTRSVAEQFLRQTLRALQPLAIHERLGMSPIGEPSAKLTTVGCPSTFISCWAATFRPQITEASRSTIDRLNRDDVHDQAKLLLSGLSGSYNCYSDRDASVLLWASIENCFAAEEERERRFSKMAVRRIRNALRTGEEIQESEIETVCQEIARLKHPTRNKMIIKKLVNLASDEAGDVGQKVRRAFDERGRVAHSLTETKALADALEGLRELACMAIEALTTEPR